jgi:hypothetical protein
LKGGVQKDSKHEEMLNIPSHKGNENQNNLEISSYLTQNGNHQIITNAGRDVGRGRNPYTLLVECKLVQLLWKLQWRLLKNLKIEQLYDLAIPDILRHVSQHTVKIPAHSCLLQH